MELLTAEAYKKLNPEERFEYLKAKLGYPEDAEKLEAVFTYNGKVTTSFQDNYFVDDLMNPYTGKKFPKCKEVLELKECGEDRLKIHVHSIIYRAEGFQEGQSYKIEFRLSLNENHFDDGRILNAIKIEEA